MEVLEGPLQDFRLLLSIVHKIHRDVESDLIAEQPEAGLKPLPLLLDSADLHAWQRVLQATVITLRPAVTVKNPRLGLKLSGSSFYFVLHVNIWRRQKLREGNPNSEARCEICTLGRWRLVCTARDMP